MCSFCQNEGEWLIGLIDLVYLLCVAQLGFVDKAHTTILISVQFRACGFVICSTFHPCLGSPSMVSDQFRLCELFRIPCTTSPFDFCADYQRNC